MRKSYPCDHAAIKYLKLKIMGLKARKFALKGKKIVVRKAYLKCPFKFLESRKFLATSSEDFV